MGVPDRLVRHPAVIGAVALACLIALIVTAPAIGQNDDPPADSGSQARTTSWHVVHDSVTEPTQAWEAVGSRLVRAPDSMKPAVNAEEAVRAAHDDGIRLDVQEAISPEVTLALLTKVAMGRVGREPPVSDRLVWDVVFPEAPSRIHGPMDADLPDTSPCDLHVLVDATTAAVIEGYQLGCRHAP